jgi:hypothetical protein
VIEFIFTKSSKAHQKLFFCIVKMLKPILIVAIAIVITTCVIFLIQHTFKPSKKVVPETPSKIAAEEEQGIGNTFPKCFDESYDAKKVFSLLISLNLHKKYSKLLEAYSMALCQVMDFLTSCDTVTMKQRIDTLTSWGANFNNNTAYNIVRSITHITSPLNDKFLTQVCDICEKQVALISQDSDVPQNIKTQIIGLNSEFYRTIFDKVNSLCP